MWLSYTQRDLSDHADAVFAALPRAGWAGVRADHLAASHRSVLDEIRGAIAGCDALIAIVAHRYGGVPTKEEGGDGRRSWVWLEVLEAEKRGLPILVFMLDERVAWPPDFVDRFAEADLLRELKDYLAQRRVYGRFSSVEILVGQVVEALRKLNVEMLEAELKRGAASPAPAVPPAQTGASTQSTPRPWFEGGVDPLLLAWRLVVDRKADPDLLLHLDPHRTLEAIEKAEREVSPTGTSSLDAILKRLEARQAGLEPNALWRAWMRQVQASRIEALTKEAPRPIPRANDAADVSGGDTGNESRAPAKGTARAQTWPKA